MKYRDPKFWPKFERQHWKPQLPTVIRSPFQTFPFAEENVLHAIHEFQKALKAGDDRFRCLLSVPNPEKTSQALVRKLANVPASSIDEFGLGACKMLKKKQMGMMINNFQSLDPALWDGATTFLTEGIPYLKTTFGRTIIDLFFGNYSKSFLGLHKDLQEIFGFVVKGKKTILAWPFDYFLTRVKGLTVAAKYFQTPLRIDYRKYKKDAIVLEAGPGDLIYWGSDYWHIAESDNSKEFSVFLSLGLFKADAKFNLKEQRPRMKSGKSFPVGLICERAKA